MPTKKQTPKPRTSTNKKAGEGCSEATCSAWEYMTDYVSRAPLEPAALNEYGAQGWELCGIISTAEVDRTMSSAWPAVSVYTFKRKILPNAIGHAPGDKGKSNE